MSDKKPVILNLTLGVILSIMVSCSPKPATPVATNGIQITNISEGKLQTEDLTQIKTFNQCASGSPFKAKVQFSESSGQSTEKELVLSGGVSGEVGLSAAAKIELQAAVEQHFQTTSSFAQAHQESVDIEVPAHTHQEYTIVWRESRQEGTVKFEENGQAKSTDYSYRIGLELVSATGVDVPCPGVLSSGQPTEPANSPSATNTPVPPPTETSESILLNDTPVGSELAVREAWVTNGVMLTLESFALGKDNSWWHEFTFYLENKSGGEIYFNANDASIEMLDVSYNIADEMHSYRVYLPDQLQNNEGARFVVGFNTLYKYDPLSTSVDYFYIRVSDLSRIDNAVWKINVPH